MTVLDDVLSIMRQQIDNEISNIPDMMTHFKNENLDWNLMITTESDFILGAAWGQVLAGFEVFFRQKYNRNPTPEEVLETDKLLLSRSSEIREAISGALFSK